MMCLLLLLFGIGPLLQLVAFRCLMAVGSLGRVGETDVQLCVLSVGRVFPQQVSENISGSLLGSLSNLKRLESTWAR